MSSRQAIEAVGPRQIQLTPSLARTFLELNTYSAQRDIVPKRLDEIETLITEDRFLTAHIGIGLCFYHNSPGRKTTFDNTPATQVLLNGQTTCQATINLNVTLPGILEVYKVYSKEQLAAVFKSFDSPMSVRTNGEIIKTMDDQYGVSWKSKTKDLLVKTLWWLSNNFEYKTALTTKKLDLFNRSYIPFGNFLDNLLYGNKHPDIQTEFLKKVPVVAAMLKSYAANPADATYFWTSVRDGTGLVVDSAEWCVRNFLTRLNSERLKRVKPTLHHGIEQLQGTVVGDKFVYDQLIRALNAYHNNEQIKLRYSMPRSDSLEPALNW